MERESEAIRLAEEAFEFVKYLTQYDDAKIPVFKEDRIYPTKQQQNQFGISPTAYEAKYSIVKIKKETAQQFYDRRLKDNERGTEKQFALKELKYLDSLSDKTKNDFESQFFIVRMFFEEAYEKLRSTGFVADKARLSIQGQKSKRKPDVESLRRAQEILKANPVSNPTHKKVHSRLTQQGLSKSESWVKKHFKTITSMKNVA